MRAQILEVANLAFNRSLAKALAEIEDWKNDELLANDKMSFEEYQMATEEELEEKDFQTAVRECEWTDLINGSVSIKDMEIPYILFIHADSDIGTKLYEVKDEEEFPTFPALAEYLIAMQVKEELQRKFPKWHIYWS
jgi:hypothetical protein